MIRTRMFVVQIPLGTQFGLGIQPCYEALSLLMALAKHCYVSAYLHELISVTVKLN